MRPRSLSQVQRTFSSSNNGHAGVDVFTSFFSFLANYRMAKHLLASEHLREAAFLVGESKFHQAIEVLENVKAQKDDAHSRIAADVERALESAFNSLDRNPLVALQINSPRKFSRSFAKKQYRKLALK